MTPVGPPTGCGASGRALVALALLVAGLYLETAHHPFFLDSGHTILENPAVRSLGNLPRFFVDPGSFSTLRSNVDYRPVLLASYALDHALGGYAMPWWHATQVLLHLLCTLGLMAFTVRLVAAMPEAERTRYRHAPLVVGLLAAVHPTASGVVNYLAGRSSMLTAVFLLASFVAFMRGREAPGYARPAWLAGALYALALFTKVEAVAGVAVFVLWEAWQARRPGREPPSFPASLVAVGSRVCLRRLGPVLGALGVYMAARAVVMAPFDYATASAPAGVTRGQYLLTQALVAWRYLRQWFAPVDLVADHGAYPVATSLGSPAVLLAVVGWVLVAALALGAWRRWPWVPFVVISSAALLSPTSSLVPLAEMLNELRPYLPVKLLALVWLLPITALATRELPRGIAAALLALVVGVFAWSTHTRNQVFLGHEAYWRDAVEKAPAARAHNNLALALQTLGRTDEAALHFDEALRLAPRWYVPAVNVAHLRERQGRLAEAAALLDGAVRDDIHAFTARVWRAEYRLRQKDYAGALADLEALEGRSLQVLRVLSAEATARAGLGDAAGCVRAFMELAGRDLEHARLQVIGVLTPFFETGPAGVRAGLVTLELLGERLPGEWWVAANLELLRARVGGEGAVSSTPDY